MEKFQPSDDEVWPIEEEIVEAIEAVHRGINRARKLGFACELPAEVAVRYDFDVSFGSGRMQFTIPLGPEAPAAPRT